MAFIRQPGDGWDVPLEKFMANLDDIVSSNGQVKSLHKILNTNAPQVSKKEVTAREFLQSLSSNKIIRFSEYQSVFEEMELPIETEKNYKISVEDFLTQHKGVVSFNSVLQNQPSLANRKYTPSDVDPEKGLICLMVSEEVQHVISSDRETTYYGTMTMQIAAMAHSFLQDSSQDIYFNGYLDLRRHKLPYDSALSKGKPIILVSTGVGIAPHLSMLRMAKREKEEPNIALMVSGGRFETDELAYDKIQKLLANNASYRYVASRGDNAQNSDIRYVQDVLLEKQELVWTILSNKEGFLYICGLEGMERGVYETLEKIATNHGMEEKKWLDNLVNEKRVYASVSGLDRFYAKKWPKEFAKRYISNNS